MKTMIANAVRILGVVIMFGLATAGCLAPPTGGEVGETQAALCPPDQLPDCPPCYQPAGCRCVAVRCATGYVCDPQQDQCVKKGGCPAGYADCDGNPANGCETSLSTTTNCGACGHACAAVDKANAACLGGRCFYACTDNAAPLCE